jgi:hypothetical protein
MKLKVCGMVFLALTAVPALTQALALADDFRPSLECTKTSSSEVMALDLEHSLMDSQSPYSGATLHGKMHCGQMGTTEGQRLWCYSDDGLDEEFAGKSYHASNVGVEFAINNDAQIVDETVQIDLPAHHMLGASSLYFKCRVLGDASQVRESLIKIANGPHVIAH